MMFSFLSLFSQDGDKKVIKSLERILSIWEDRGVYSGTLISELRSSLVKEESPVQTPVEQKSKHIIWQVSSFSPIFSQWF